MLELIHFPTRTNFKVETKFVALTHLVAILDFEVLFLHFLNFLVGYELWSNTKALLGRF